MLKKNITTKDNEMLSDIANIKSFGNNTLVENLVKAETAIKKVEREQKNYNHSHSQFAWKHFVIGGQHSSSRSIRQIASEIQNKKMALIENKYKIIKDLTQAQIYDDEARSERNTYKKKLLIIKADQLRVNIENTITYYEGALKDVLTLSMIYDDLTKTFNTEEDFEKAETEYWIRRLINQAVWDFRETGKIRIGDQEALEQIGINPTSVFHDINNFMEKEWKSDDITTDPLNKFLAESAKKYKSCPMKALESKGISFKIVKDSLFLGEEHNGS